MLKNGTMTNRFQLGPPEIVESLTPPSPTGNATPQYDHILVYTHHIWHTYFSYTTRVPNNLRSIRLMNTSVPALDGLYNDNTRILHARTHTVSCL